MGKKIRVLLVEYKKDSIKLIRKYLLDVTIFDIELRVVNNLSDTRTMLENHQTDVILLSFDLLGDTGFETITELTTNYPSVPIVIIAERSDKNWAIEEVVTKGAQDYLFIDSINTDVLIRSIRYSIESKLSKMEIRESEKRLKIAQHIAKLGFLTWDLETNEIEWTDEVFDIYGVDREKFQPTIEFTTSMIHPEDYDFVQENLESAKAGKKKYDIDHRIIRPDGKIIWVHTQGELIYDSSRTPKTFLKTVIDITEQKKIETLLLEERNRAQLYLDIAGVIFIALDMNGNIIMMNQKACKILGCSPKEYIGKNWFENFIPEREKDEVSKVFTRIMQGEIQNSKYNENEVVTLEGEERTIAWNNTLLTDSSGRIIGTLSSGVDITEKKQAEEELRESEQRNRMIVDAMSDLVFVYDLDGTYCDYYSKDESLLVRPWSEMKGRNLVDFIPRDTVDQYEKYAKEVKETEKSITYEYELEIDGSLKWFQGTVMLHEDREHIITAVKDITDQKIAEENLKKSEKKYRTLYERLSDALFISDKDGYITMCNNKAVELFDYDKNELLNFHFTDLLHPNDRQRMQDAHEQHLEAGEGINGDFVVKALKKDGTDFDVSITVTILIEQGEPAGYQSLVRDITKQKKAEKKLRESEERHRLVLSSMSDLIFVLDKNNDYVEFYASDKVRPIVPPEQFIGKNVSEILPSKIAQTIIESVERVRKTGNHETLEYSLQVEKQERWYSAALDLHHDGERIVTTVRDITFRKRAENASVERELEYQSLVSNIPGAVYHCACDKYWTMFFLTDTIEEISGYPASDFILNHNRSFASIIHPDDRQYVSDEVTKSINKGESYLLEYRILNADGNVRWIRERGREIPESIDETGYLDGILFDITDEKLAAEEMNRLREIKQATFNLSQALRKTLDLNIIYKTVHNHLRQLMDTSVFIVSYFEKNTRQITAGYVATDKGIVDAQNLPPIPLEDEGMGTQSQVIRTGKPLYIPDLVSALEKTKTEYTLKSDGDVLHGSPPNDDEPRSRSAIYVPLLLANEVIGVLQVQSYNSNAYNSEQLDILSNLANVVSLAIQNARLFKNIEESEERFRLLVEGSFDGIFILEGQICLDMNKQMAEMIGKDRDDLIGSNILDYWTSESRGRILDYTRAGSSEIIEIDLLSSDGTIYSVEAMGKDCFYNGKKARIVATRDITGQKKAQQKAQQAGDTALLYLDIMSHDLRNHLQAVVMASEIMQYMELDVESILALEIIIEAVQKSQKLINKVLATRDLLSIPLSELPLRPAIENSLALVKTNYDDVIIEKKYHILNPLVNADKFLEQLLMNILDNAIEYNERVERKVWIEVQEMGHGYQVSIKDNGQGISDEKKESLFDPTRRFGGVGIHQAIRILQKYGGHISVHDRVASDSTQGAEFRLWFPKARILTQNET
ncbi:MAG: PAS domain S-box protein [Candidatus Thorarchaeota archaeon]